MADTTIGITLKGTDQASKTISKVAGQLDSLGKKSASGQLSAGFDKVIKSGVGQLTSGLGQIGGALASLGPAGIAVGTVITAAFKRIRYEIEQNVNAVKDQQKAIESMSAAADKYINSLEKRVAIEKQLRNIQLDIDNADPVDRAISKLDSADSEIATVRAEIERLQGVRDVALRTANEATANIKESVWYDPIGHYIDSAPNKANEELAEASRKKAQAAMEKMAELQSRLSVLAKERELAEKNIADAVEKQKNETLEKAKAEAKAEADRRTKEEISQLTKRRKELEEQLRLQEKIASSLKTNANLYSSDSHSTTLLLDRLSGNTQDATTLEMANNTRTMADALVEINQKLEELGAI